MIEFICCLLASLISVERTFFKYAIELQTRVTVYKRYLHFVCSYSLIIHEPRDLRDVLSFL